MIKIKIENHFEKVNHPFQDVSGGVLQELLEVTKNRLEFESNNAVCETHKSKSKGTITVKANNRKPEVLYSDFCCEYFQKKFR